MPPRLPWLLLAIVIAYVIVAQTPLGESLGRSGRLLAAGAAIVLVVVAETVAAKKSRSEDG